MGVLSQFKHLKMTDPKKPTVSKSDTNQETRIHGKTNQETPSQSIDKTVEGSHESNSNDHEMSSSELIYENVKGSHEFKIKGYSLAKGTGVGKFRTSAKFTVGGHDWVIKFYPDGDIQASEEYVSVYFELVSPAEVRASIELKLLDQSGKGNKYGFHRSSQFVTFNKNKGTWGWPQYMKRSDLEASDYLKDDCLSIHCTVKLVQNHVEEGKNDVIHVPPSYMFQNLKDLLESQIGCDITLQVGNESFRAHKSILAARSPVFRAQFFGPLSNPYMEILPIEDFDPFVFKAVLLFLYSDELPEAHELSDSKSLYTSTTIIQHLLDAANRFHIARLKLICEAKLCEEITANTVATILVLAERTQCLLLKTVCLNFAAENMGEVIKSNGFAHLEESFPSLSIAMLKTCAVSKATPATTALKICAVSETTTTPTAPPEPATTALEICAVSETTTTTPTAPPEPAATALEICAVSETTTTTTPTAPPEPLDSDCSNFVNSSF